MWIVDISVETNPVPIATFQVAGIDDMPQPEFTGCHQPAEQVYPGGRVLRAGRAQGLRRVFS